MNRRLTGILAWCALGLIVAIPGTDMLMKNAGQDQAEMAQSASGNGAPLIGPQLQDGPSELAQALADDNGFDMLQPAIDDAAKNETVVAAVEPMPSQPAALPSIVPLGAVRSEMTAEVDAAKPEMMTATPIEVARREQPTVPLQSAAAPVSEPASDDLQVAAIDPAEEQKHENVAPVPLPADLRPMPQVIARATSRDGEKPLPTLEDDVRSSINVIEASRRPVVVMEQPVNQRFWGDDPDLRNGRRLDTFTSEEIARADDASDSPFYELWREENRPVGFQRRGSFSEQLPARRGSAIRMDLLQQRN